MALSMCHSLLLFPLHSLLLFPIHSLLFFPSRQAQNICLFFDRYRKLEVFFLSNGIQRPRINFPALPP